MSGPLTVRVPPSSGLRAFDEALSQAIVEGNDVPATTRTVRSLVRTSLRDERFVRDCIDLSVQRLVRDGTSWADPPLIDDDAHGFGVRLFFWPPGYVNDPHEHTCWTVTGVLWNELVFSTYTKHGDGGLLEPDRVIVASQGEVGYVIPPCVHSVANQSAAPSISLHVFSGPKVEPGSYQRGETRWYHTEHATPPPGSGPLEAPVRAIAAVLEQDGTPWSLDLLEQMLPLPSLTCRLICVKAMARRDPRRASAHVLELAARCAPRDAARLEALGRTLAAGRP